MLLISACGHCDLAVGIWGCVFLEFWECVTCILTVKQDSTQVCSSSFSDFWFYDSDFEFCCSAFILLSGICMQQHLLWFHISCFWFCSARKLWSIKHFALFVVWQRCQWRRRRPSSRSILCRGWLTSQQRLLCPWIEVAAVVAIVWASRMLSSWAMSLFSPLPCDSVVAKFSAWALLMCCFYMEVCVCVADC